MRDRIARIPEIVTAALGGRWEIASVTDLREQRAVAVLAETGLPRKKVVVKLFPDSEQSQRAADALTLISARLAESKRSSFLTVPGLLFHDKAHALLAQSHASGIALDSVSTQVLTTRMESISRALAELHRLPAHGAVPRTLADQMTELIRPGPAQLAADLPEHAALIESAVQRMHQWDRQDPAPPRPCLLHRDFQLRQLFDAGTGITVVDWDDLAAGDPAFDIGYFIAYLRSHLPQTVASTCSAAFLRGYRSYGTSNTTDRLPLWLAFNLLRRAARRWRLRDPGWEAEMTKMLSELRGHLQGSTIQA